MADLKFGIQAYLDDTKLVSGLKGTGQKLKAFSASMKSAFLPIIGVVGLLTAGITKAIKEQSKQQAATEALTSAMKNNGTYTKEAIKDQEKFAAAMQKTTRFGDDQVLMAQSLLVRLAGLSGEGLNKATMATADLAEALKMDFQSAASLVGKTLGSSTNALMRYGVQVEGAAGSQDRLNSLLKNASAIAGGAASDAMNTFSGKMARLNNAIGDAFEAMGVKLLPAFEKFVTKITLLAEDEAFLAWIGKVGDSLVQLGRLAWNLGDRLGNSFHNDTEIIATMKKINELTAERASLTGKAAEKKDKQIRAELKNLDYWEKIYKKSTGREFFVEKSAPPATATPTGKKSGKPAREFESPEAAKKRIDDAAKAVREASKKAYSERMADYNLFIAKQKAAGTFSAQELRKIEADGLQRIMSDKRIGHEDQLKLQTDLMAKKTEIDENDIVLQAERNAWRIESEENVMTSLQASWSDYYDANLSMLENWANATKSTLKGFLLDYIEGQKQQVIATTARGIAEAVASKQWGQAALVASTGAAQIVAIDMAKSAVQGLAVGGITQGETIARIGEQGKKEAVIPLESPLGRRALDKAGGGGIGSNEPVNVTLMVDGRKLAEIVANRQAEASRQGRF